MAGLPDPAAPEVTELTDLPWAAELGRIKARMEARAGAAAAADPSPGATATPAAPAPPAAFDPDHATLEELDAQMALLESRRARIQREATIAASAGTGSAAAAAMTAAAGVPQGGQRAAEPAPHEEPRRATQHPGSHIGRGCQRKRTNGPVLGVMGGEVGFLGAGLIFLVLTQNR